MTSRSTAPTVGADTRKDLARFLIEQVKDGRLDKERAAGFLKELTGGGRERDDIAIIGMAGRFPQADTLDAFWANLAVGRDCIRPFPPARRAKLAAQDDQRTELFAGGFLTSVDDFDNEYFQIPPRVARHMDPYHRLMLETLVQTIENAGYYRGALYGQPVGVFVGNDHTHRLFNSYIHFIEDVDFHSVTGSWTAVLASRISYLFNFSGPALVLDSACSSGLVALDNAIKALRDGDCDSALVAAANLFFAPIKGLVGEIENETFQVRAFDRRAGGTTWGEGLAAIMIKPLAQAQRDGDPIHAVIRGIAVNNDGASNGLTAPNAKAQQEVILKAWQRARLDPANLGYIETHGTGTQLGDPIEIKGLTGAFARHGQRRQFCPIGSVKTNIGHTVGVAGLASLIKVVLSFKHGQIPPSIHFDEPNHYIDFCNSPVFVNDRLLPWPRGEQVRLAGVSSFSLSGTNCHVVLQEPPQPVPSASGRLRLVPLSARTRALFSATVANLLGYLAAEPTADLGRIAYTAALGRESHHLRAAVLADSLEGLRTGLARLADLLASGVETCAEDQLFCRCLATVPEPDPQARPRRDAALSRLHVQGNDAVALADLARLYVAGMPIPWAELFQVEQLGRASLPAQPFERHHFWDQSLAALRPGGLGAAVPVGDGAGETASADRAMPSRASLVAEVQAAPAGTEPPPGVADGLPYLVVARVWCEVLGYAHIAANDDFHALGGDSVSAMRVVHIINSLFGLSLGLADLLTVSTFADFVAMLLERHDFAAALRGQGTVAEPDGPLPLEASSSYALSRAQKRMFLLARISEGSTAYNVSGLVRLAEAPDTAALAAVVRQVISRHEILRTGFEEIDGDYRQVVYDDAPFALEEVTLPSATDAEAELALVQQAVGRLIQPFDLARPPLMRMVLMRGGAGRSYLAIDLHHIITDGSSMGVLVADMTALAEGRSLPVLPFQYKDFAAWQNRRFAADADHAHAEFWRQRFAGDLPEQELVGDFPRPAFQDYRGGRCHRLISAPLAGRLRALARHQGVTLFVLLLAAFKTLLHKLGGGHDIVVGSPVAGRTRWSLQGLMGMFVNTLALRDRVEPGARFCDFLAKVMVNTLAALDHQEYPYEELVERLQLPRDGSRNPLFDICFLLQNEDIGVAGGGVEMLPLDATSAKFDLSLVMRDTGAGLTADWEYATALFLPATIVRFGDYFEHLLTAIADHPERSCGELSLRPPPALPPPLGQALPGPTIAALFEARVDARPDAPAVSRGGERLSYGQLDRAANRLAHALIHAGLERGDCVAVAQNDDLATVVSIVALVKAGAVWLPLTGALPPGALADLPAQVRPRWLLGEERTVADALGLPLLSPSALTAAPRPDSRLELPVSDQDGACLRCLADGSALGVLSQHSVIGQADTDLAIGGEAACLFTVQAQPDLFAALLNGARLVLPDGAPTDPAQLGRMVLEQDVSHLFLSTEILHEVLDQHPQTLAGLRCLVFGGGRPSPPRLAKVLELLGSGRLVYTWGVADISPWACLAVIDAHALEQPRLAITPAAHVTALVVDELRQAVPPGVVGELCLAAADPLHRPELTSERLFSDPTAGRCIATGELARRREDGFLELLGRPERRFRLGGYRIDPERIETELMQQSPVRACRVAATLDASGQPVSCAWVVATPTAGLEQAVLAALSLALPASQLPQAIVCLAAWPTGGDAALPGPSRLAESGGVARDEREADLVAVLREVLGLGEIGIHDNFFSLGGDSIKAIQVVARLRARGYQVRVPLLFQHMTIAELAPWLVHEAAVSASSAASARVDAPGAEGLGPGELDAIFDDLGIV